MPLWRGGPWPKKCTLCWLEQCKNVAHANEMALFYSTPENNDFTVQSIQQSKISVQNAGERMHWDIIQFDPIEQSAKTHGQKSICRDVCVWHYVTYSYDVNPTCTRVQLLRVTAKKQPKPPGWNNRRPKNWPMYSGLWLTPQGPSRKWRCRQTWSSTPEWLQGVKYQLGRSQ